MTVYLERTKNKMTEEQLKELERDKVALELAKKNYHKLKERENEDNFLKGMELSVIKDIYDRWGSLVDQDETYKSYLATEQTSVKRTLDKIENFRYVNGLGIRVEDWKFLDSSVTTLCRKNNVNPEDYMYLSYSDVKKELE